MSRIAECPQGEFLPWAGDYIPVLQRCVFDSSSQVKNRAVACLAEMGLAGIEKERVVRIFSEMLADPEREWQIRAASWLYDLERKDLIPPVLLREVEHLRREPPKGLI